MLLASLFQLMSQADMLAEGQRVGRVGYAAGFCGEYGYVVDYPLTITMAEDFSARATSAGFSADAITHAIDEGIKAEEAAFGTFNLPDGLSFVEIRTRTEVTFRS